jgi:hypothetical protein
MSYRPVPLLRFNSLEFMMLATSPRQFGLLAPALMALVLGAPRAFALDIELVPTANLSANSAALAAFSRAAARWSEHLLDPITVRITADFSALGSASVIGQASSVLIYSDSYAEIRDAMVADAALEADDGIESRRREGGQDIGDGIIGGGRVKNRFLQTGLKLVFAATQE